MAGLEIPMSTQEPVDELLKRVEAADAPARRRRRGRVQPRVALSVRSVPAKEILEFDFASGVKVRSTLVRLSLGVSSRAT